MKAVVVAALLACSCDRSPEYAGTVNVVRLGAAGTVAVTRAELDIAREPSAVE